MRPLTETNTWNDYATVALSRKCYSEHHCFTYPLLSLQTELVELNEALRALDKCMTHVVPGAKLLPNWGQMDLSAARDELGDVIWAFTALASVFESKNQWNLPLCAISDEARVDLTANPCKLKVAVAEIQKKLNPLADSICKDLRAGERHASKPVDMHLSFLVMQRQIVRLAIALGSSLHLIMQHQLTKMARREEIGSFVVLSDDTAVSK